MFEVCGTPKEVILLQPNPLETERLAVVDGIFAMLRMATFHVEELMFVHGFDMQVSLHLSVFEVDPCVQETDLLCQPGCSKRDG